MNILVTGADGYCGWPIVLRIVKDIPEAVVIAVDNLARRGWVKEVGHDTIVTISSFQDRIEKASKYFKRKILAYQEDLCNYKTVNALLKTFEPEVILHLASQPSAPYSEESIERWTYTQNNNMAMLRNIIWSMKENKLKSHLVVTTTTGIYGAPHFDIPEGDVMIDGQPYPYPSMSGSWYHMSRAFDASHLWLANKKYDFPITEFRTSIVCGSSTEETRLVPEFSTRFDADFYFGVVTNRFVMQALSGKPLTIYGKGLQKKPMISLEDMVESMVEICRPNSLREQDPKKYVIYNQTSGAVGIVDIANTIKDSLEARFNFPVEVTHIPNPRVEDEEHNMYIACDKFEKFIGGFKSSILDSIDQMCADLYPYREKD